MNPTECLAFDRASVRTIDANGRLQISRTNISKANVNAYYGREIPRSEELGLEPNKLYRLWRHPDELRKAAKTFNNIPVLSKHIPDFPTDPPNEFRVGVTHSNAEFDGTYLTVGMSIWDNSAIAGIESGEQRELSASYKYVADMTPGVTPDGETYDGVMRDIFGNHEALVPDGRAGPDVLVADSLPPELNHMRKHKVAAIRATNCARGKRPRSCPTICRISGRASSPSPITIRSKKSTNGSGLNRACPPPITSGESSLTSGLSGCP